MSYIIKKTTNMMMKQILKRGFVTQKFEGLNERLIEYKFLFDVLNKNTDIKKILDVGSGTSPLPALLSLIGYHVTAIDNIKDYWKGNPNNNHFYIINDDITDTKLKEQYDMVICISTLEHIKDYMTAIVNIWKLLKPCGSLILTFPYNCSTYLPNIYEVVDVPTQPDFICQIFSEVELEGMLGNRFDWVFAERWKCFSGDFWRMGERLKKPAKEPLAQQPDLICLWWKKK